MGLPNRPGNLQAFLKRDKVVEILGIFVDVDLDQFATPPEPWAWESKILSDQQPVIG
jgi:hypothetical protein